MADRYVNIAVRIRPPLRPTDPGFDLIPQRFQKSMVHVTSPTSLVVDAPQGRKLFLFDRVFGEDVQQDGIWDYISGSVESFFQGYNVSVMAYGQSGAGKSFTMGTSGPSEQNDKQLMGTFSAKCSSCRYLESPRYRTKSSSGSVRQAKPCSAWSPTYEFRPTKPQPILYELCSYIWRAKIYSF